MKKQLITAAIVLLILYIIFRLADRKIKSITGGKFGLITALEVGGGLYVGKKIYTAFKASGVGSALVGRKASQAAAAELATAEGAGALSATEGAAVVTEGAGALSAEAAAAAVTEGAGALSAEELLLLAI